MADQLSSSESFTANNAKKQTAVSEVKAKSRELARQALLEALFDFWASQAEVLRLAIHWSRYEDSLLTAVNKVEEIMSPSAGDMLARFARAEAALESDTHLSIDQRGEALRRGFQKALMDNRADSEEKKSKTGDLAAKVLERREDLGLLSSQLVTLVADFELFVLRVMTIWLELDPTLLKKRGLSFTFEELSSWESLDALLETEVHNFLEEHMRKSANDWFKQFRTMLGVSKLEGTEDFRLLEVFQRRHIVVHHGGLVSRQYMKNLEKFEHGAQYGDHLAVDLDYVQKAADCLAVTSHSILVSALFAAAVGEAERTQVEEEVAESTFVLLKQERFEVVERFTTSFDIGRIKREFSRSQLQVNGWIAKSRLGKKEEVKTAVNAWDVSAKDNKFKVARLALLGEVDELAKLLRAMLEAEEFSKLQVLTWPLFDDVRSELMEALTL